MKYWLKIVVVLFLAAASTMRYGQRPARGSLAVGHVASHG